MPSEERITKIEWVQLGPFQVAAGSVAGLRSLLTGLLVLGVAGLLLVTMLLVLRHKKVAAWVAQRFPKKARFILGHQV